MTNLENLADELYSIGTQAGLAEIGITGAENFDFAKKMLTTRKSQGFSGGMNFTYRNPKRSTTPSVTLSTSASLIVGAMSYFSHPVISEAEEPQAQVALYATKDYYFELRRALHLIAVHLQSAGYKAVVLADDNALVDRAAAHRAGIGWFGKNSNILLPKKGSYFILGSVLTDAKLKHAEPINEDCGGCEECMTICPTNAILESGVIDARRCLAWLLQKTGVFPTEYRVALKNRIYGCDDCQSVCPINKLGERRQSEVPSQQNQMPVFEILQATDQELLTKYAHWYIPKRDPKFIRRNALVVLGNISLDTLDSQNQKKVERLLRKYLVDSDAILQAHAVWAAKRLERYDLLEELEVELNATQDIVVLEELRRPISLEPA